MAREETAGDRYRLQYRPGRSGMFSSRGRAGSLPRRAQPNSPAQQVRRLDESKLPARGKAVYLTDAAGTVVWHKMVSSDHEADALIDLIRTQVLTARLVDFEAWLASQRAEQA